MARKRARRTDERLIGRPTAGLVPGVASTFTPGQGVKGAKAVGSVTVPRADLPGVDVPGIGRNKGVGPSSKKPVPGLGTISTPTQPGPTASHPYPGLKPPQRGRR